MSSCLVVHPDEDRSVYHARRGILSLSRHVLEPRERAQRSDWARFTRGFALVARER
jgi:hypothetical protein